VEGELQDVPIVLVVEDEESLQEIVHDALKHGGFEAWLARGCPASVSALMVLKSRT
jgi:DNA-binding response OmpR family regulator